MSTQPRSCLVFTTSDWHSLSSTFPESFPKHLSLFSTLTEVSMSSDDVRCIRRLTARQERVAVTVQALRRGAAARRSFLRMRAAATTVQVLLACCSLMIRRTVAS
jgi:hypothetical protein